MFPSIGVKSTFLAGAELYALLCLNCWEEWRSNGDSPGWYYISLLSHVFHVRGWKWRTNILLVFILSLVLTPAPVVMYSSHWHYSDYCWEKFNFGPGSRVTIASILTRLQNDWFQHKILSFWLDFNNVLTKGHTKQIPNEKIFCVLINAWGTCDLWLSLLSSL